MRSLRSQFESAALVGHKPGVAAVEENYASSVVDMMPMNPMNQSTVMIVEADVTKLARRPEGQLAIKVATIFNDPNAVEMDDFLANEATDWQMISLQEESQPYMHLPESLTLKAGATVTTEFDKGQGQGQLLMLYPNNRTVLSDVLQDDEMQILNPQFGL
jgi:hypothetical protein